MHHAAACFCFTLHFIHCVLLFERCYAFDPGPHGLEVKYKQASKQAGARAVASMEDRGADARIAGARAFASMEDRGADARIAGAVSPVHINTPLAHGVHSYLHPTSQSRLKKKQYNPDMHPNSRLMLPRKLPPKRMPPRRTFPRRCPLPPERMLLLPRKLPPKSMPPRRPLPRRVRTPLAHGLHSYLRPT